METEQRMDRPVEAEKEVEIFEEVMIAPDAAAAAAAAAENQEEENKEENESSSSSSSVDWQDLSRKIRAVMHLASVLGASNGGGGVDGRNRYEDELYAFVEGQTKKAKKSLELLWVSPGLTSWDKSLPEVCQADPRDHEALLRKHLSDYALVIRKQPGFWQCLIHSPDPQEQRQQWRQSIGPRVVCLPKTV